jgi:lipopolysaccharide transport system permease protein
MKTGKYHLINLYNRRELLWVWTLREIRVQYKQSILGVAWAILQPLSLMIIFTIVFSVIVNIPTGDIPYPLFSYTAVLPWTFFATSITMGVPSLVSNLNLVTKVSMPREIFPVSTVLASLFNFLIASILFVGMLFYYNVSLNWNFFWIFPLLCIQIILTIAVVLTGSAINVLYRDIRFIIPLAIQLWMYATPIIYPLEMIPEKIKPLFYLNPMTVVIIGYRQVILSGLAPNIELTILAFALSSFFLIFSFILFKKLEPIFADII